MRVMDHGEDRAFVCQSYAPDCRRVVDGPLVTGHAGQVDIVVGVVVLVWLLRRQLTARPVTERLGTATVLLLIGLVQTVANVQEQPLRPAPVMSLVLSLILGLLLSVARAYSMRVFVLDGTLMRRGTALTMVLWLTAVVIHWALAHTGSQPKVATSLLAYIGYSLLAQQLTMRVRTRHLRTLTGRGA